MKRKRKLKSAKRRIVTVTKVMYYPHPALKKCGVTDKHHIVAKEFGGAHGPSLRIDRMKHCAYHFLFKNKSLLEASEFLKRLHRAAVYKARTKNYKKSA